MRLRNSILVVIVLSFWASNVKSEASCDGPHEVCGFVSYVLKLKVGRRLGNAVYIGPGWAVTNRHIILLSEGTFVETKTGERCSTRFVSVFVFVLIFGFSNFDFRNILPTNIFNLVNAVLTWATQPECRIVASAVRRHSKAEA